VEKPRGEGGGGRVGKGEEKRDVARETEREKGSAGGGTREVSGKKVGKGGKGWDVS